MSVSTKTIKVFGQNLTAQEVSELYDLPLVTIQIWLDHSLDVESEIIKLINLAGAS